MLNKFKKLIEINFADAELVDENPLQMEYINEYMNGCMLSLTLTPRGIINVFAFDQHDSIIFNNTMDINDPSLKSKLLALSERISERTTYADAMMV